MVTKIEEEGVEEEEEATKVIEQTKTDLIRVETSIMATHRYTLSILLTIPTKMQLTKLCEMLRERILRMEEIRRIRSRNNMRNFSSCTIYIIMRVLSMWMICPMYHTEIRKFST